MICDIRDSPKQGLVMMKIIALSVKLVDGSGLDLIKLWNNFKDGIDKMIKDLLFKCTLFIIDLIYNILYRMIPVVTITICHIRVYDHIAEIHAIKRQKVLCIPLSNYLPGNS
ncbi:hypothetical protein BDA99DRAFT_536736 [Phascolomyces articulosus]|uniref:Uncharacterized protein n=1 Tax=Phascolomyces articulosus TaxID=60185 RepID=A0AAD5PGR3_9FUNG|nr:hypothetical protein BDA99DRAFT_536736 [Phascolomyces articulosus]